MNLYPFALWKDGTLKATKAEISGVITANTGYIGGANGWVIKSGAIYSGITSLDSTIAESASGIFLGVNGINCLGNNNKF